MVQQTTATAGNAQQSSSLYGGTAANKANATQDMFVTLLLAQVKNQDPMKPMDNMDFTNQLAMFNQLNEMQKVNTNFDKLNEFNQTMSQSSYLNLLDKKVTAYGSEIVVDKAGAPQQVEFQLDGDAANTSMTLIDERGMVRATLDLGKRTAGDNAYTWNGMDENGRQLPPGKYSPVISGTNPDGSEAKGALYATGIVSTITSSNGETILKLANGQTVAAKDILKVETQQAAAI